MSTKTRRAAGIALLGAGLVVLSCSADRGSALVGADASTSAPVSAAPVESSAAATRITELRARFRFLGAPVAPRFEMAAGPDAATCVRAVFPTEALRGVTRVAHVALPLRADGEVELEDDTSHLSVRFVLAHVRDAHVEVAGGMALYRGALDGADVVHRVHAEGTEDFVVFETRPTNEELSYSVDVSHVPGLRLVSNTLEFLDESGTPLLRVAPPYVVDATGERHGATLAVNGCAYDANPAGPWGRKVTRPGAERCTVRVVWSDGIAYPAVIDPAWGATGSMAMSRQSHTASVLPSGRVLVAGGNNGGPSAEVYDPGGNGGAGTFAATGAMVATRFGHTASVLPTGKVLLAGGGLLSSAELFDASAGTFSATGSMGTPREFHTASVLPSGKVLVAGGQSGPPATSSAEIFDPAGNAGAGTFAPVGSMATARQNHTASVLLSGKVLVAGGCNGNPCTSLSSAELFDPSGNAGAGSFAATGFMATARTQHTSSALPSGKVLVAGGYDANYATLSSAALYDPAGNAGAGTFVVAGTMLAARAGHTASLLASGKVLVAGGLALSSAELFDPAGNAGTGTFAAASSMTAVRRWHTASVLPEGKVVVVGGQGAGNAYLLSAETYGGTLGEACTASAYCLSGSCADGFCCDSACSGGCDRCDLSGKKGTCSLVALGETGANPACTFPVVCDGVNATCTSCASDAACAAVYYCAPDGTCQPRKAQAVACDAQTNCKEPNCRECASGFCVDGLCCDTACNGTCQACAAALKYSGAADGTCDTARSNLNRGDAGAACGPLGATCDGDHTAKAADGTTKDCAPYKCDSNGTCRPTCTSVNDCVTPTICDPSGKCVPPAPTASDGGCAISTAGTPASPRLPWLTAVAALVLTRLRRRRRNDHGTPPPPGER